MSKKVLYGSILAVLLAVLTIAVIFRIGSISTTAQTANTLSAPNPEPTQMLAVTPTSGVNQPAAHLDLTALTVEPATLSQEETAGLIFMREEEKLALDVYLEMYKIWGQQTFQNIASTEQNHTDAVLALLQAYGIADPVGDAANGVYENADLQSLYNQLIAQGSISLADALKVGAAIEEIDILDLRKWNEKTDNKEIEAVYTSLELGSENHLRAFTSTLTRRSGETYKPQYLEDAAYQKIISAAK
jgi:hypothetical protein